MFYILYIVPKKWLSYLTGIVVSIPIGNWAIRLFAKAYNINLNEAEKDISEYSSIGSFFTRKLKEGARPITSDWVHPVDAEIREHDFIDSDRLLQIKGINYTLADLLQDQKEAKNFINGYFITYYLCPTDYHHIHFATNAEIRKSQHIPGALWPVNDWSVANIKSLFTINERTVSYMQTNMGAMACVNIGATNVGKITLSYDKTFITNQWKQKKRSTHYNPPIKVSVGEELGIFHMGSTVVILLEKSIIENYNFVFTKEKVKLGQAWKIKK